MKYLITILSLTFFCLFTFSNSGIAQNDVDEELKNIDGTVDKITITADGEEYTFEGRISGSYIGLPFDNPLPKVLAIIIAPRQSNLSASWTI